MIVAKNSQRKYRNKNRFSKSKREMPNRCRFDNSPVMLTFERTQPLTTMPHIAYKKALVLATETVVAQDILKA